MDFKTAMAIEMSDRGFHLKADDPDLANEYAKDRVARGDANIAAESARNAKTYRRAYQKRSPRLRREMRKFYPKLMKNH